MKLPWRSMVSRLSTSRAAERRGELLSPAWLALLAASKRAARRIAARADAACVGLRSGDDVGALDEALEALAMATEERARALAGREDAQRQHQAELQFERDRLERLSVVGELASAIAHELNNPLTAISMFAQMLLDQLAADSQAHACAEVIHRNTLACRHTLLSLLGLTRNAPTEPVDLELDAVVEEAIELLRPLAVKARVELRTIGRTGHESVRADEHQVRQALVNVVMNAIHAAAETRRGEVGIGTEVRGHELVIRVEDNGNGVPSALADRIFEPFFTTRAAGEGTGLGLSTSRRIVEAHGGQLVLCPSGEGEGAVFEIRLPRLEADSNSAYERTPLELAC